MVVEFFASLKTQKRPLGFSLIKILLQLIKPTYEFLKRQYDLRYYVLFVIRSY